MDIGVYEKQSTGKYKLVEGPWTVSLVPRYPGSDTNRVLDPTTGRYIFIEEVINEESNLVRCLASTRDLVTDEPNAEFPSVTKLVDSEEKRLQVMLMLSTYTPLGTANIAATGTGITLKNGTDGTGLYNESGNIQPSDALYAKVALAYNGQLTDDNVDELREVVYPIYQPDYIVCGGYPASVQYHANELATYRGDCICLADTGSYYTSYDKDLAARETIVPWNSWNSMLYVQYRRISDAYTGRKFWVSPVYHAIQRHLYCDATYFLSEPVAGITKGSIDESIVLTYKGNHTVRGDLGDAELNCTINIFSCA